MASDSEASCVSDPNFAVICGFLEKFGASCGITSPDFLELQEMLENTQELPQELIDIHIKLLRKVKKSVSADRWERVLIKLCHIHCTQDAWELERFGYKKARLSSKLRILKILLEMQFDFNQKFKAEVNRLTANELRTEPIGRDKHGHSYWYQIDEHCQLRVYREDPDEETWALVANDREGLVRLISQLASDDPNLGDLALNEDSNSLEIEKPILDTGQTSSSTSNCEAEVDESSAGNEDSKDVPSEASPTETSPIETSATETFATENKTPVDVKSTEEQPRKLRFMISSKSVILHKPDEQPENLAIDAKNTETKPEENVEKTCGIDLSVPQTSIQRQTRGVDLTNKRKKSINDLAANLRMKSHDMLYKNPVQEQEIDLSVKKPRMDPKQFSSLSVPPFEPISIESALRMSSEFAESDEDMEDEDDEFYDEDEIELPSHMKQPRLDRPTLLGNTKKKTYSDEDEDYGEEIEEPVMLIQGEGSGKDCDNENIHVNKSEDYSEAVEEPMMFFYGEGSGFECDTGNTGKEEQTTNSDRNSNDLKDATCSQDIKSNTVDPDSELKPLKDTESAANSLCEVLEATDKQSIEKCTEQTVVACDSKDIKSVSLVNEVKAKELSPKSQKVGTVIIDVKSSDRNQISDAVCSKKFSRWDIGKPVEGDTLKCPKNDDSTKKELCDDSTNSSIKINDILDVKLLNVSRDEIDNTISDISVTNVKTAVNKTSELQSNQGSDTKELENDNLTVDSPADTHEALTDELEESEETDDATKQPLFFFGPRCFQFKTPMAPYSPDVKGSKSSDIVLKSDEPQDKFDQDSEKSTEKISLISESVPTCINKADILVDNKEQNTFLQTNLSSEIKNTCDTELDENIDVNKENLEQSKNISDLHENICIPEKDVKKSIDNKKSLPIEISEESKISDNNSSVVELPLKEEMKNLDEDTTKIEILSYKTQIEEENKLLAVDTCIKEKQSENSSSETKLDSSTSKQNKTESEEKKNKQEGENKIKINTTENNSQEEKDDTPESESKTSEDASNTEGIEIDLVDSTNISLKESTDTKTVASSVEKNVSVEQNDNFQSDSNSVELITYSKENIPSQEEIKDLKIDVDNASDTSVKIVRDKLSSTNIKTEDCEKPNSETAKKYNVDAVITAEASNATKESDEITDDKSETLSETLESLSTLIETKSDESDDQVKKSDIVHKGSNSENAQITNTNSNSENEKSADNDSVSKTSEEKTVKPDGNNQNTSEVQISASNNENSETAKECTEEPTKEDVVEDNIYDTSEEDILEKNTEDLAEIKLDDDKCSLDAKEEISSSTVEEHITTTASENTSNTSEEKVDMKIKCEVVNKEGFTTASTKDLSTNEEISSSNIEENISEITSNTSENIDHKVEIEVNDENQEVVSSSVSSVENNLITAQKSPDKIKVDNSDDEKLNTDISSTNTEKDFVVQNERKSTEDVQDNQSSPSSAEDFDETPENDDHIAPPDKEVLKTEISAEKSKNDIQTSSHVEEDFKVKVAVDELSENNIKISTCIEDNSKEELIACETDIKTTTSVKDESKVESSKNKINMTEIFESQLPAPTVSEEIKITDSKVENKLLPEVKSNTADEHTTVINTEEHPADTEKNASFESVKPISETVSVSLKDECKPETIVDKITMTTREENNVTPVVDAELKPESPDPSTEGEETKNIETKMELGESRCEIKIKDSKHETVIEHTTEINKEKNVELLTQSETDKFKSEKFVDESINKDSVESVTEERIDKITSNKNVESISIIKDSVEKSLSISSNTIHAENKNVIEIPKSEPVAEEMSHDTENPETSFDNKTDYCNTNANKILKDATEKKQEIEKVTQNLLSKSKEISLTNLSKNEKIECSDRNSDNDSDSKDSLTKVTKDSTEQKNSGIDKTVTGNKEITTNIKAPVTDLNSDIVIENVKEDCNSKKESESNKSVLNLKDKKNDTLENSATEINKQLVEINHATKGNDTENIKAGDDLKNPKQIIDKTDEKQCMEENNDKKESVSEKVIDSVFETAINADICKHNESKTIKSIEITTLKPVVVKKKIDNKKSNEITSKQKESKKENSAEKIHVNSREKEVKDFKNSDIKIKLSTETFVVKVNEKLQTDSVFDKVKEKNQSKVFKSSKKDSKSIEKNKDRTGLLQSNQNAEDSSDDDMMGSCGFEEGNDYNEDSESEEKPTVVKKDNIPDKIHERKGKLNHSELKVQGTTSKIVIKNIKDLIDDKHKFLIEKCESVKPEISIKKIKVKEIDYVKEKLHNLPEIDIKPIRVKRSDTVNIAKVEIKDNRPTTGRILRSKSEVKKEEKKFNYKKSTPTLTCIDITKLQVKPPLKAENKKVVEMKQQSYISSPRLLESIGIDNEESSDVIDVPETDPLACTEEEILMSKKIEEESAKRKPKGLSLATFKLDDPEDTDTSALIPAPIARALRNRKISIEPVNTSNRKRSNDGAVEGSGAKKQRSRATRSVTVGKRVEVNKDSSSEEEIIEVKVTTPQRGTGKARRGRVRGRGGGTANTERVANISPVPSSDPQSETSRTEVIPSPVEQKTPPARRKRRVLGLDIDPAAIIQPEQKTENDEPTTRSSIRQSRRIAQIKIKEEAERRKIEELTHIDLKEDHHKKKKKKDDDKDYKVDKKKKKQKVVTEDEEDSDEEITEISKSKHKKKRKHQDLRKLFNISNPWQSSSESSTSNEEEEEEEAEEEPTDEEAVVKSDHEFSPESDLESNIEVQPLRRARTVKKESDTEEPTDEHACQKCGKADHPEWILLCDKCDCGWHCSCLRPALLVIPEGDWFCPPCQHNTLIEALKTQLVEYDKKMNRREMEVRRKQRLAYVGISLDNVLPTKEQETGKPDDEKEQDQEMASGNDSSESGSSSSSGSSSGDESEPIYQLRERRQAHSYRFNDYDELINSAIQDELEAVKGAGNQGRGKDIATIVNAEKEEKAFLEQKKLQEPEIERPPPVVPVYKEKTAQDPDASDESSDDEPRVVPKLGRKKHRKLNSLDISSEDDPDDDEDFKGTSASEEEDLEDLGSDDSDELGIGRRGRGRHGPTRRSTRARTTRYDREFINDNSEDDTPKRKKTKSIWDESESEESDKSWGKRKKSKKQRYFSTPRPSKKSRKRKRRALDDSDPEVKRRPKKPRIKYGGLNDSDDEELLTRRTRGKKINYIDALGSDSEEDKIKVKPLESEDEYVANEEDEDVDEPVDAVEDEDKDSDSDSAEIKPMVMQRKIIKIIAPSKVAKGRGKAGIPRPQHLKPVTPPPPPAPPVVPEPEPMDETPEDVEDEEDDTEPPVPADIPVIAANPDDLNEEEVGTMMMENEEYAKKQLELMAIQLAKEKKKKEKEAKKLAEKKEVIAPPPVVIPTGPKKRGRKKKSEIEAAQVAAAAAAVAAAAAAAQEPPIAINPALVQPPAIPLNQSESPEKLTPPNSNLNISPGEIPVTVPTVVSDLANSPPKRRGRGKGKKTLAAEAAAAAGDPPLPGASAPQSPVETIVAPTIIPPPPPAVLASTAAISPSANIIPTSAQTDPQNLSPNPNIHGGKLGIAAPPQPFSQNQPTPSVITRMLQSQPISAQTFTTSTNAMTQKYFPPGIPPEQQPPRGTPAGQFSPIAGRGRVPSPYRQSPPALGMYPGVRPLAPNSPHRLRSPGPPNMQMFHTTHHSMDPSPSGGGPINIASTNRDRNSPGNVSSPMTSKEGPTPPPPPYSRAITVNRFSPNETSPGPSLPLPIRHHLFPQAAAHLQPSPPPRPPPPGNFSPYHPPPPPNYHYGAYPPAPSLAAADDALPPTDYPGSPYPEQYNTAEGTVHSSEGSNSKPFDEEGSGEFGGLVSYFSSQREDDLDT